eukprot:494808_1
MSSFKISTRCDSVSMSTLSVQVANNDTDTDNIDKDDVIIENEGDVIDTYRLDVKMHDNNDDKPIDEHEEGDLGNDYQTLEAGRKMNDSEMVVTCEGPNNSDGQKPWRCPKSEKASVLSLQN